MINICRTPPDRTLSAAIKPTHWSGIPALITRTTPPSGNRVRLRNRAGIPMTQYRRRDVNTERHVIGGELATLYRNIPVSPQRWSLLWSVLLLGYS